MKTMKLRSRLAAVWILSLALFAAACPPAFCQDSRHPFDTQAAANSGLAITDGAVQVDPVNSARAILTFRIKLNPSAAILGQSYTLLLDDSTRVVQLTVDQRPVPVTDPHGVLWSMEGGSPGSSTVAATLAFAFGASGHRSIAMGGTVGLVDGRVLRDAQAIDADVSIDDIDADNSVAASTPNTSNSITPHSVIAPLPPVVDEAAVEAAGQDVATQPNILLAMAAAAVQAARLVKMGAVKLGPTVTITTIVVALGDYWWYAHTGHLGPFTGIGYRLGGVWYGTNTYIELSPDPRVTRYSQLRLHEEEHRTPEEWIEEAKRRLGDQKDDPERVLDELVFLITQHTSLDARANLYRAIRIWRDRHPGIDFRFGKIRGSKTVAIVYVWPNGDRSKKPKVYRIESGYSDQYPDPDNPNLAAHEVWVRVLEVTTGSGEDEFNLEAVGRGNMDKERPDGTTIHRSL